MSTEQKIRFIEAVMNGELVVRNRRMDDVIADMQFLVYLVNYCGQ